MNVDGDESSEPPCNHRLAIVLVFFFNVFAIHKFDIRCEEDGVTFSSTCVVNVSRHRWLEVRKTLNGLEQTRRGWIPTPKNITPD